MGELKERLYQRVVRKNELVRKEYERYVLGHLEEHGKRRLKHWAVLFWLKWKYRKSRGGRLQLFLLRQKKGKARLQMERILGAVCYNLYVSEDGVHYRFLTKKKNRIYETERLSPNRLYFYKYKVSMDGTHYNEFSKVLSVSTVENQELYWMTKLTRLKQELPGGLFSGNGRQREEPAPSAACRGQREPNGGLRAEPTAEGGISLSWNLVPGAIHYNLYRARRGGEFRFLARTEGASFRDPSAEGDTEYLYKLKYTKDGNRYRDLAKPLAVRMPRSRYGENGGRLYEKGAESQAAKRMSAMNFAKSLMPYETVSFDIFDTLLFRPFAKPSDLFILVGERLDIMDFCEIRKGAEEKARKVSQAVKGSREVTIFEIYRYVAEETGVEEAAAARLEFEIEKSLCYANPYMLTVFRILKEQGKRMVALSDMYLPGEWMRELLEHCGYEGFDEVIVSCDYHCSKRSGGLYEILLSHGAPDPEGNRAPADPALVVHTGDNQTADVEAASEKGIAARYYQNVNEAGREFRCKNMSYLVGSAYRGIVNAHLHSGMERFSPYYEVGYVYTGLYVMGFCQWIYRYAKEKGITKILFLAREGDLYQKVFQAMHPEMETEYVLWSRIPVVKTIAGKNRHPYLLQILHHKANALYKSRLGRLFDKVGIGKLKGYFPDYRLHEEEYLTPENEQAARSLLLDHWEELQECYRQDQEAIRQYLTRKIGDCRRAAVVDVGWSGNNVLQVKYLAEQVYGLDCCIHCLLAAARNVNDTYMAAMIQKREAATYLFSPLENKGLHDSHQAGNGKLNSFFFEILTQSCTPTFLGFGEGGKFLYDIPEVENYAHNRELHRGALDFVSEYQRRFRDFDYMLDVSGHDAYMPFQYFSSNLSWIRKYFGDYRFGRDLFATQDKAEMETVEEVMRKAKIWEETT